MRKGTIHQEEITDISIYATNIVSPKYAKQLLTDLKGEIDGNKIILGFYYPTNINE